MSGMSGTTRSKLGWVVAGLAVYAAACAHGKMGQVSQPLDRSQVTKSTPIFVEPVSAQEATFSGDKAAEPGRVADEKRAIRDLYSKRIAEELRKRGYAAEAVDAPVKSGIVITGKVSRVEHGSAAARMLVGMGSGSANLYTNFRVEDRAQAKVLSRFEVIATSGGRGGLTAAGSFLDGHLTDGAEKVAEYIDGAK